MILKETLLSIHIRIHSFAVSYLYLQYWLSFVSCGAAKIGKEAEDSSVLFCSKPEHIIYKQEAQDKSGL